jgi:hypothetical protein
VQGDLASNLKGFSDKKNFIRIKAKSEENPVIISIPEYPRTD